MRHPLFQTRVLIAYLAFWCVLALTQAGISVVVIKASYEGALIDGFVSHAWAAALGVSLWYALAYHVFKQTSLGNIFHMVLHHLFLGGTFAIIWAGGIYTFLSALYTDNSQTIAVLQAAHPWRLVAGVFYYLLLVLTYSLFHFMDALRERIESESRLQSLLHQSELDLLKSQLNPHFLFNSLNSVSALVDLDPAKAQEMIACLAEYLRFSIASPAHTQIPLEDELKNVRRYMSIERIRFGDRFAYSESIEPGCLQAKIPPMLLQPLYENAIKHGAAECVGPAHIYTEIVARQDYVQLTITNTVERPSSRKGTGLGQRNVRERLRLFYGEGKTRMQAKLAPNCYTLEISIPFLI